MRRRPRRPEPSRGVRCRRGTEDVGECWFATEVLDGNIRLPQHVGPDLYPLLEKVGLVDVKRIKAYLLWEEAGSPWDPHGRDQTFWRACEQLQETALEPKSKGSRHTFASIARYLVERYV